MSSDDVSRVATMVLEQLQQAWNRGDGTAYAEPFTGDADFVNVRGGLFAGPEIGPGHQRLFGGIYAGSTIAYRLVRVRPVDDRVALAHFRGSLRVPSGPAAGPQEALGSLVLTDTPLGWRVRAFHNTHIT